MTKSDNAEAFSIHYDMMNISGIWPKNDPSIPYSLKTLLSWTLGSTLCITMMMEVIHDINDFTKLSEILYIVMTISIYLIKLATFSYHRKTFLEMINFLKDPIFSSYPEDLDHYMVETIKLAKLIANVYRYLCLCCMVMFGVYPIADRKELPFPFPYDLGRYKGIMYFLQIVGVSSCAWNNSCLDTLTTSLMGIATAHLDILVEKISGIADEETEVEEFNGIREKCIVTKLKQCIKHHNAIIKYIGFINIVFAVGFLAQFAASVMVICNTLFHFLLISRTSSQFFVLLNYFAIMCCELFINCWYGNEILWKSTLIGEACYTSKWYNHSKEVRQYLFIIMERSKIPLTVTAFKMSKLSLSAFASIIRSTYSYFALLLNLYSKKRPVEIPNI